LVHQTYTLGERQGGSALREGGAGAMSLLEAQQVSVRFGGLVALRNLDMRQDANEALGMIGSNGSGRPLSSTSSLATSNRRAASSISTVCRSPGAGRLRSPAPG
jgi:ABC-type molybdenum transport system ATPase subunit/photorepair protein PhrA